MSVGDDQANVIPFRKAKDGGVSQGVGEFFAFDHRSFTEACKLGLNAAVAYLVIARGGYTKSFWSVDAIERKTGMGRIRAKAAIAKLTDAGMLTRERGGTRPQYGIVAAHALPQLALSEDQRKLLEALGEGKSVRPKRSAADDLVRRGFLEKHWNGGYSIKSGAADLLSPEPQHIWLPNAIVDGAADEPPPLALLRQMQDIRKLQLFVALYDNNDLPNSGGVSRNVLYQEHTVSKVSQRGALTIWGFDGAARTSSAGGSPLPRPFRTGVKHETYSDTGFPDFWEALNCFQSCGLLTFIPHVFESDKPDAEVLHAYPIKDAGCEPWELEVATAAHAAGIVCIPASQQEWAAQLGRHLLALPSSLNDLAVIGIARLRYRPRTRMTAAWFAITKERCGKWVQEYQKVAEANKNAGQAVETNMKYKRET
jgi:hypothetical protein